MTNLCGLTEHERQALMASLERDIENETDKARRNDGMATYHCYNVHVSKRLLSLLSGGASGARCNLI